MSQSQSHLTVSTDSTSRARIRFNLIRIFHFDATRDRTHTWFVPGKLQRAFSVYAFNLLHSNGAAGVAMTLPQGNSAEAFEIFVEWMYTGDYEEIEGQVYGFDANPNPTCHELEIKTGARID
jgi:hypothetical protein